jgi:hypothetical protein
MRRIIWSRIALITAMAQWSALGRGGLAGTQLADLSVETRPRITPFIGHVGQDVGDFVVVELVHRTA